MNVFKKVVLLMLLASACLTPVMSIAADSMPPMPKPTPEHAWLQQFVGNWASETEMIMAPGQPATHTKGTETIRPVGGFWILTDVKSTMDKQPYAGVMTLGYDPEQKEYVGTWVDSMTSHMWEYEGTVDASGKKLTLESQGSCPIQPGKIMKFKETLELQDKDHKTFSSYVQGDNGQWILMMTSHAHRVK